VVCPECGAPTGSPVPTAPAPPNKDFEISGYDGNSLIAFVLMMAVGIVMMVRMPHNQLPGFLVTFMFGGMAVCNAVIIFLRMIQ
jgi:hypothetical protein